MLRQPIGTVQGVALRYYRPGQVYDLPVTLASYLVAEKYAIVELRWEQNMNVVIERDRRLKPPQGSD